MHCPSCSLLVALGLLVLGSAAAQAAGTVSVSYIQPDKFADAADARRDIEGNLSALTRHLELLGERHLSTGQKLTIEVLDVDLAGEVRPLRRLQQDVRVLKGGVDWPRIKLRYTLESPGQPTRRDEQTVADMAYLQRISRYPDGESLQYEKRMLDEWFVAQFGAAAAAR